MANSEEKRLTGGYLESKVNYAKPEDILYIYEKAVKENIFSTPVGMIYLKRLQDFLLEQKEIDPASVIAIPLNKTYQGQSKDEKEKAQSKSEKALEAKKSQLTISIILNILLVIAMIAIFVISLNSDNPNIINYERTITNRYASWEQDLNERENAIRERERELMTEESILEIGE